MAKDSAQLTSSLSRHILCAVPQLLDPNFHRSVILMLEHEDSGSLGLILNQRTTTKVLDIAESLGLDWVGDPDQRVRIGGPVEQVRGWILHDQGQWDPSSNAICDGLYLTTSLEPVLRAGRATLGNDDSQFQFLLGYAGWGAGQIETEMAAGSWVAVPILEHDGVDLGMGVSPQWLLETSPKDMWSSALKSIGVEPEQLVGLKSNGSMMH